MFRPSRSITGHHLRMALYVVLSASSGVAWVVGLWGITGVMGAGGKSGIPVAVALLLGASSGLLVGLCMSRIYRADLRNTIYSAPLALWVGAGSYLMQLSFYRDPDNYLPILLAPLVVVLYTILGPLLLLMPFVIINGLLLRLVLTHGSDQYED